MSCLWPPRLPRLLQPFAVRSQKYVIYRVSQQVWNRLKAMFWYSEACERSELRFGKNVFCSKNCFFSLICQLQNWKWNFSATLLQLSYVVTYSVNCLKLEKSCLKIPFSILQFTKKAQKAIFWSELHFFEKLIQIFFCFFRNSSVHLATNAK